MPQDRAPQNRDPHDRVQGTGAPGGGGAASDSDPPGAPSSQSAQPPAQQGTYFLGRYRVVDEIGIGGMASVHLARMDGPGGFQKWVAIKRIHPHLVEDESFVQMFLDEARVAARISHPNVATVFDLGKHEDTYWIAMEYLHGEPLREVMRRTEELGAPMPPEIACRVIADAAEGLNSAHELVGKNGEKLNLIHRDVTPHNLFVTYDGTTKVVDFGIAKFSSRMSSTRAGTLKGKLAYMSPEQVQGETIDRRTDIFALGVVLWELTTGQRLFRMDSDLDTLAKVQECAIPRPSSIVRGYPIDLEKIVMKALAKNRGERFRTAREFSRALQSLLMRRGLFIASDEVSAYVQSIFQERIAKREAHLRWAGEVTQTINVEGMLEAPAALPAPRDRSVRSYASEVQAASHPSRSVPRPAAGAPAAAINYLGSSGASPSLPTHAHPSRVDRLAETAEAGHGVSLQVTGPHPADDEAPTMQATAEQRAAVEYGGGSGFDDDFEDNDDTIVSTTEINDGGPQAPRPSSAPAPLPAAGRPASTVPMAPRGAPFAGGPRTLPIGMQSPVGTSNRQTLEGRPAPATGPATLPMQNAPSTLVEEQVPVNPFGATVPPNISDPALPPRAGNFPPYPGYGQQNQVPAYGQPPHPTAAAPGYPHPTGPGVDMPPYPRQPIPTQPRLFVPSQQDQRTQTVQRRARVPMWLVAVLSGVAALFVAVVVFVVVTHASSSPLKTAASNVPNVPNVPSLTPPAPSPVPAPGKGPFALARASFLAATVEPPGPTSMAAPSADATDAVSPPPNAAPTHAVTPAPPPVVLPPPPQAAPQSVSQPPSQGPRRVAPTSDPTAQGQLTVVCFPACDQVIDNGKSLGSSPIFKRSVNVGVHRLKLVAGGASKTISASVIVDQLTTIRESMQP